MRDARVVRSGIALLLAVGAWLEMLPWIDCTFALGAWREDLARICTFGVGVPGFGTPRWPNLVLAAIYMATAIWIANTRRIDFAARGGPEA